MPDRMAISSATPMSPRIVPPRWPAASSSPIASRSRAAVPTREELRTRFRAGAGARRYTGLRDVVIHETAEPGVVIAEYSVDGELTGTSEPFSLRFVMVMTIRDGQIVHTRDYSDPIAGARALGRLPQLLAALTGGQDG